VLASALVWLAVSRPETGRLTVTFLDVGQGDAILIEGPLGHRVLVDGGPSGKAITAALGRQLPFHDRRLDLVALTHPQQDHIGGLPAVLKEYSVGRVLSGPQESDSAASRAWSQALDDREVPETSAQRGQTIDLGGGALLTVLGPVASGDVDPQAINDASLVFRLSMGEVSFLLTGDISEAGEAALVRSGADLSASVLKVAHHGSRTSTSLAFVQRTTPLVDVISVGADNSYGHPTDEVLSRLEGDVIVRTDHHGDITVSTEGRRLWVRTQRGDPMSALLD
jgi:competence protein ComEC